MKRNIWRLPFPERRRRIAKFLTKNVLKHIGFVIVTNETFEGLMFGPVEQKVKAFEKQVDAFYAPWGGAR